MEARKVTRRAEPGSDMSKGCGKADLLKEGVCFTFHVKITCHKGYFLMQIINEDKLPTEAQTTHAFQRQRKAQILPKDFRVYFY